MLQEAPPAWFRDEVHVLITRGDISPEEGLLTVIHPPEWAYGPKPPGAGTTPIIGIGKDCKVCSKCFIERPIEDFYAKPSGRVHSHCRPCEAAQRAKNKAAWTPERWEQERARDRARNKVAA